MSSSSLRIRPAAADELGQVASLVLHGLAERWGTLDPHLDLDLQSLSEGMAHGLVLTAWLGPTLVGTGTLVGGPDTAEIVRMSTAHDFRRRGVASRLLAALVDAARDRGAARVALETTATWTDARRLYEHEGFVLDAVVHGPHGDDAHYHLDLDPLPVPP